jgi:hypothetical protein
MPLRLRNDGIGVSPGRCSTLCTHRTGRTKLGPWLRSLVVCIRQKPTSSVLDAGREERLAAAGGKSRSDVARELIEEAIAARATDGLKKPRKK